MKFANLRRVHSKLAPAIRLRVMIWLLPATLIAHALAVAWCALDSRSSRASRWARIALLFVVPASVLVAWSRWEQAHAPPPDSGEPILLLRDPPDPTWERLLAGTAGLVLLAGLIAWLGTMIHVVVELVHGPRRGCAFGVVATLLAYVASRNLE